jgi:hypothetical protein
MIDAEVVRLRNLRNVALRARVLAQVLDSDRSADDSVFARSALMCWAIARIATGHLRAHPYLSYQKDPSPTRDLIDRAVVSVTGWLARHQERTSNVYAKQLQILARELDDTRALTWSPALSDALGRSQVTLRLLIKEIDAGARHATHEVEAPRLGHRALENAEIASNWPYLAI